MATDEIAQLKAGMAALEAQRGIIGDAMVEVMLGPIRDKLAALEAQSRADQQRKQATVLFADVSGFTAMSETLDAELVAGIMNDLWAEVDRTITDQGGRIDKHIGDAVMALWGADTAREDDPERAVRAALAMQAAVASFCATHNVPLALRIGVNTGPVVLGAVATTAEFTAMGDAVNLASRLEHAAPVDGILIGHDTYRHVRGIFDVEEQTPLAVKGKAEPVQAYVVQQAKPRAFRMKTRGVEGVETRMVGRDRELGMLQDIYADAMAARETRIVNVVGEAGVGKSRLLYEFDKWLALRPEFIFYFKGRATPNLQNVPNSLFRDLFAARFEIFDSDSTATALDKFRRGMEGTLEPDRADVVGHWLGFDFSASEAVGRLLGSGDFGAAARTHLVRYFRTLATAGPVVVLLEDMHWADDQSLDVVTYLLEAIPQAKLLLVAVTRPILFERRPGWGEGPTAFRRVNLSPLARADSQVLVGEILQRVDQIPDSLRNLIINTAEGNPFYVEELVKMLIEQGVIERGIRNYELGIRNEEGAGGEWRVASGAQERPNTDPRNTDLLNTEHWTVRTDKLAGLKVPPTLHGLLQARLDGLPRSEREALQRAAVVGRQFWDDAVADLMMVERQAVRETLQATRGRELIFQRERSSFDAADEYIFKHALLRDVAYETVLLKYRAEFHGKVARWLEQHAGERRDEYLGLIAEHYVQAGAGLKAAELLERSAAEAFKRGAALPVRAALERALALREAAGQTDGPEVTAAWLLLGRTLSELGDLPAAEAALERALDGARREGDRDREAVALVRLGYAAVRRGQYDQAGAQVEAAVRLARAAGGPSLPEVLQLAGHSAWHVGDLDLAAERSKEAQAQGMRRSDAAVAMAALIILGNVAADRGDLDQADALYGAVLDEARRHGDVAREVMALVNLGVNAYERGDYVTARAYAETALESARDLGDRQSVIITSLNLAQAELMLGDAAAARRGFREVLATSLSLGMLPSGLFGLIGAAQALVVEGQMERALALYGLTQAHPALENQARLEINRDLARLALPPEEVAAGLAAGAALDFDTVVEEILEGKW